MIQSINTLINKKLPSYGVKAGVMDHNNDEAACSMTSIETKDIDAESKSIHSLSEPSSSFSSPRSSPVSSTDSISFDEFKTSPSLDLIIKSFKDRLTEDNISKHSKLLYLTLMHRYRKMPSQCCPISTYHQRVMKVVCIWLLIWVDLHFVLLLLPLHHQMENTHPESTE